MGGKVQQRVAGNAKPTSSGRVRELLNSQHGSGNPFITFSALNCPLKKKEKIEVGNPIEDQPKPIVESKIETLEPEDVKTKRSTTDRPVLVMKRVGDREFFVKVLKDEIQSKAGVVNSETIFPQKKEKNQAEDSIESKIEDLNLTNDLNQKQDAGSEISESDIEDDDLDDEMNKIDFDNLLDRLFTIQDDIQPDIKTLKQMDKQTISKELAVVRLLNCLARKFYTELSIVEWDVIIQAILRWVSLISKTESLIGLEHDRSALANEIIKFIYRLKLLAKSCEINKFEEAPMMESLVDDWNNFSSSRVYQDLLMSYFRIAQIDSFNEEDEKLIKSMTSLIIDVDPSFMTTRLGFPKPENIELDDDYKLPKNSCFCILHNRHTRSFMTMCNLLRKNNRCFIISAHSMLSSVIESICESLLIDSDESNQMEDTLLLPPVAIFSILVSRDSMMTALLSDYKVGDISVRIDPQSDSYRCVLSYLLLWDVIIQFIITVGKESGHCLIHSLKKLGFIQRLLDNIFVLLPPPRDQLNAPNEFLKNKLKTNVTRSRNEIDLIALHVFFSVACHMPVTVRKWYNNNSNKRLCNLVNEYTVKHISQVICSQEMESVHIKCQDRAEQDRSKNLIIRARPNAKEVYAIYTRDEFKMELTIKLPINYPLGPVQIDGGKRIGVTDVKWRGWLLQLTRFLAHQNGPLLDGIDLWRRNIDKRFEGVEKCMICFSILHSNYQLPKKRCQTCSKMFHNLCIYKWFESSGNSTCPLCRNIW